MRAIGYVRVSTEQQAQEGVSLESQAAKIEAYCVYRGLTLVDTIQDAGVSGAKNKARPGFIDLLNRIDAGDIEAVVLFSLERLSRDMLTLLALERLLDEHDIELHTVEGQVDTSTPDGWLNFAMKAFLGEMERRQVKYRTRAAMQHKKSQGAVVGSIPYGYRREGQELVQDTGEQAIVHHARVLHQKGARLADICRSLTDRGMLTRTGRAFTPEQVKRILPDRMQAFSHSNTRLGQNIRGFIEAIA